jgi:hypothetical protein
MSLAPAGTTPPPDPIPPQKVSDQAPVLPEFQSTTVNDDAPAGNPPPPVGP